MEFIGQPFVIQNTDRGWRITWDQACNHSDEDGEITEFVSFTVIVPRKGGLTISECQTFALKRAEELIQERIRLTPAF